MNEQTRNLLISLASHMAYMQGQLEAFTQQSDPEDYYWYRESVALRQKVIDALAEGREPASVTGEPSDEELLERQAAGLAARPLIERVAALGDIIGEQTVGQVRALADSAAAWLAENPPGQPVAIEPVRVSERLPGAEDCDAEGRCWWWYPPVPEQNYGYWIYEDNAVPERSRLEWPDSWLPAHAVPLPSGEVEP